jgi:hypothetical protein
MALRLDSFQRSVSVFGALVMTFALVVYSSPMAALA